MGTSRKHWERDLVNRLDSHHTARQRLPAMCSEINLCVNAWGSDSANGYAILARVLTCIVLRSGQLGNPIGLPILGRVPRKALSTPVALILFTSATRSFGIFGSLGSLSLFSAVILAVFSAVFSAVRAERKSTPQQASKTMGNKFWNRFQATWISSIRQSQKAVKLKKRCGVNWGKFTFCAAA